MRVIAKGPSIGYTVAFVVLIGVYAWNKIKSYFADSSDRAANVDSR